LAAGTWPKLDPCEGAISPDQPACERRAEAVERKIELGWQKRKVVEPQANAPIAQIPYAARMNVPEAGNGEQGVSVNPLPFSGASFSAGTHGNASLGRGRHRLVSGDPWPCDVRCTHHRPVAGGE
jgi:hypothetical protein